MVSDKTTKYMADALKRALKDNPDNERSAYTLPVKIDAASIDYLCKDPHLEFFVDLTNNIIDSERKISEDVRDWAMIQSTEWQEAANAHLYVIHAPHNLLNKVLTALGTAWLTSASLYVLSQNPLVGGAAALAVGGTQLWFVLFQEHLPGMVQDPPPAYAP